MTRALRASLLLALLMTPSLHAQLLKERTFGALLGVSLAKATGADAEGSKVATGVAVGGFLTLGFTKGIALEPQLLLLDKGIKGENESDGSSATVKVSYLQMPLLLKARFPLGSADRSGFVFAGPGVALKVGCRISLKSGGVDLNTGCDDSENQISSIDTGIMGGVGLDLGRATFSVRYDRSLSRIDSSSNPSDIKNTAIVLLAGVKFRFNPGA